MTTCLNSWTSDVTLLNTSQVFTSSCSTQSWTFTPRTESVNVHKSHSNDYQNSLTTLKLLAKVHSISIPSLQMKKLPYHFVSSQQRWSMVTMLLTSPFKISFCVMTCSTLLLNTFPWSRMCYKLQSTSESFCSTIQVTLIFINRTIAYNLQ